MMVIIGHKCESLSVWWEIKGKVEGERKEY
jgi:hypothetical protein